MTEKKKLQCPECKVGGYKIRHRVTSNTYLCMQCGHVWKKDEK